MTSRRKEQINALLKAIETGDPNPIAVVNPNMYIQHNPKTHEGGEGLAALFKRLAKSEPRVNIVRIFEDGHYVFAHTEYDFTSLKIGFEVFRFVDGLVVEHWDNIQPRRGPNASGHSMVSGPTQSTDLSLTETNRAIARSFVQDVLIDRQYQLMDQTVDKSLIQHSPSLIDGSAALRAKLEARTELGFTVQYDRNHHLLAEGDFVLSASEGFLRGVHTAFFDLFRLARGKIVEHWDTIEAIPPRDEWNNENGKF